MDRLDSGARTTVRARWARRLAVWPVAVQHAHGNASSISTQAVCPSLGQFRYLIFFKGTTYLYSTVRHRVVVTARKVAANRRYYLSSRPRSSL
jgi:hypothetical protein